MDVILILIKLFFDRMFESELSMHVLETGSYMAMSRQFRRT